jgi:hypothetical protein
LADILDELLDRVTDLKDANLNGYPDISQIRLSNIEWNNSSDKIKITNWHNMYTSRNNNKTWQNLSDMKVTREFIDFLKK